MNWFKRANEDDSYYEARIDEINKYILEIGYPPVWARDWAISKLNSGEVPQEWIDRITKDIIERGSPHPWARDWAKNKLNNGEAPKEWTDAISRGIVIFCSPGSWAEGWAKKKLDSGEAPQEWIDAINEFTIKAGYSPIWVKDFMNNVISLKYPGIYSKYPAIIKNPIIQELRFKRILYNSKKSNQGKY